MGAAVAATGYNLVKGGFGTDFVRGFAEFDVCGQGLRERGDVKLRGVLVGRIGTIERDRGRCTVAVDVQPQDLDQVPANVGAQIRAKTVFGEKWLELLYPDDPVGEFAAGDIIPSSRTIEPLEVETILNLSGPLLDAIDPEHLAGALEALTAGFAGHEDAAIRGIESGSEAIAPITEDPGLAGEGVRQLKEASDVFDDLDEDLLAALENLDAVNRFTTANQALIAENLRKAPELLRELSTLFETRFADLTKIADRGATVIGVLASRADDLDRLLEVLPRFNSAWIRNINHICEHRQLNDEGGAPQPGGRVPGRCWRVHNILSESRGPYGPGEGPRTKGSGSERVTIGLDRTVPIERLLLAPIDGLRGVR